jgi:predicted transcriptional regulator of viral defense system
VSGKIHHCLRFVKTDWQKTLSEVFDGATVLRSKDLESRGLARSSIRVAASAGALDRVGRGLYALRGAEVSEHHSLVQVARRVPKAAICLLSALRFHDLTSQNPHEVWIAIGPKDRMPQVDHPPVRVVRFGAGHFTVGLEAHEVEGTRLQVYSVARTLVDLFRYRHKIGIDVALEALKEAWREQRFTLPEINRIAGRCRMSKVMKPYLESLAV